jgi:hypothetical protein
VSSELRRAEAKEKPLGRSGKEKKGGRGRGPAWWRVEEEGGGSGRPATTRRGRGGRRSGDTRTGEEGVQLGGVWRKREGGPGGRQRPDAAEAGAGRATREQGRRGSGRVGPAWKREGAHEPVEEKENGLGPKKQCNFLLNQK